MSSSLVPRTINPRALLVLVAAALVMGVTVHFVHGYQVKRNARDLLAHAGQMEQEDQLDQAADMLSQYLGMMPTDNEALIRFGLLLDRLAHNGRAKLRALLVLNQALNRDRERADVRRQAARIALEIRWFKEAKVHLEILLKGSTPDAELLRLFARSEVGARQYEKAAEQYARAIQLAPRDAELCQEYALLLREYLKRPDVANSIMEGLIAQDDRAVPARLAAARYYVRYSMPEKAEVHTQFLLTELAADDADVLLLATEAAQAQGKLEEARAHLNRGIKAHPDDARLSYQMAQVEIQAGQRQKAAQLLEPRLQSLPKDPKELEKLASLLLNTGEKDRALTVIKQLRETGSAPATDYLEARALAQQEDYGKARTLLEKVSKESLRIPELRKRAELLLAECYRHLGSPDERLRACHRALEGDRHWLPARRELADALLRTGKLDEAIQEYRQIVDELPEVRSTLASLLISSNLSAPAAMRNWIEVQTLIQELGKDKQRAGEAKLLEIRLLLAQNKLKEARNMLEAERARDPKQIAPWLLLVGLVQREGRKETILPLLSDAERQAGKHPEWELARMGYWASSGQAQARLELPKIEQRLDQYPEADQEQLRTSLARAYGIVAEPEAAERVWRQLAQRQPRNLTVRFALFERAIGTDKEKEAERLLGEIRNLEGGRKAYTVYGEAAQHFLRVRHGEKESLAEARRCLREAAVLRPTWSRVPLLEAYFEELEKRPDKALSHYQTALALGENEPSIVRRVLELLSREGRYTEANTLLRKLPEEAIASPELGRVAIEVSVAESATDSSADSESARLRALEQARKVVGADSKNHRDHLWLGQVAALAGQQPEAEKAFRQARQLAPSDPETWVTLILFLARSNAQQAAAELAKAERQLPKDQASLALGTCCEALGRLEEAEKHYGAALANKPVDVAVLRNVAAFFDRRGQRDKAEQLLRRLLATETKAPEETAAWARRTLAISLARGGTYAQFREAQALLEKENKGGAAELEDRRVRAQILASQPPHRQEAIQLYEGLPAAWRSKRPDISFRLARLYEAEGNWPKARRLMQTLLAADDQNSAYIAFFVGALLRHKEAEVASGWAERLAKLDPKNITFLNLQVRVFHANGKTEEARRLVAAYAGEKDARLDLAARLFEVLGQADEAEKLFRAHVARSGKPEDVLLLAQHLGGHGRVTEALDLCEQVWPKCPPEQVAWASVSIATSAAAPEGQRDRVERLLTAAIEKRPDSLLVVGPLAELHNRRGHVREAMRLYRRILQQEPTRVLALNNLAYLLALQGDKGEEALTLIQAAIDQAGPQAELLDTRALAHLVRGEAAPALKDMQQVVAQAPSPEKYFHLAQAHLQAKDRPAARKAYRRATELGLRETDLAVPERVAFRRLAAEL